MGACITAHSLLCSALFFRSWPKGVDPACLPAYPERIRQEPATVTLDRLHTEVDNSPVREKHEEEEQQGVQEDITQDASADTGDISEGSVSEREGDVEPKNLMEESSGRPHIRKRRPRSRQPRKQAPRAVKREPPKACGIAKDDSALLDVAVLDAESAQWKLNAWRARVVATAAGIAIIISLQVLRE